jgi:transposase-like protein
VIDQTEKEPCSACLYCERQNIVKNGRDRRGAQVYRCADCDRSFTALTGTPFSGHSFPAEVIGLAVRWYLRFRLSYADVVEWLAERHIQVDPSTVFDWVQKFAPLYQDAAKVHRHRVGSRWSVDETYVKVAGRWGYVYRAIDEHGQVVEVLFQEHRDTEAATVFFRSALENTGGDSAHGDHRQSRGLPARAGRRPPGGRAYHRKSRAATHRAGPPAPQRKTEGVSRLQDRGRSTALLPSSWLCPEPPARFLPARDGPAEPERCQAATAGPSLGGTHGPIAGGLTEATAGSSRRTAKVCFTHSHHSSLHAPIKPLTVLCL